MSLPGQGRMWDVRAYFSEDSHVTVIVHFSCVFVGEAALLSSHLWISRVVIRTLCVFKCVCVSSQEKNNGRVDTDSLVADPLLIVSELISQPPHRSLFLACIYGLLICNITASSRV